MQCLLAYQNREPFLNQLLQLAFLQFRIYDPGILWTLSLLLQISSSPFWIFLHQKMWCQRRPGQLSLYLNTRDGLKSWSNLCQQFFINSLVLQETPKYCLGASWALGALNLAFQYTITRNIHIASKELFSLSVRLNCLRNKCFQTVDGLGHPSGMADGTGCFKAHVTSIQCFNTHQ